MSTIRIVLANMRVPKTPQEAVILAKEAIAQASQKGALIICFPECFVPGYRWPGKIAPPPDPVFLEQAWAKVADAAKAVSIAVILGTDRLSDRGLQIMTCVADSNREILLNH